VALIAVCAAGCARNVQPGALEGWNVLLITVDTLRADRVGFAGYEPAETPAMDGLAERGAAFLNAVASAPVTLPSHATILTGLYPPAHGALDNGLYELAEGVPTLAGVLAGRGYQTAGFIGAFVLAGKYGTARGFQHFDDELRGPRRMGHNYKERRAEEVTDAVLDWVRERDRARPYFAWAHYFDPHAPYDSPGDFAYRFPGRPYDGEIAYTDHQIGRLLDGLREDGALERTLIVLTADHGEAFGDGGELTHGLLLRGSTLRVPLVISAPGGLPRGVRVEGTVSTADILPTVLELVGVETPAVDGVSLVAVLGGDAPPERAAYSETRLPFDEYGWSMLAGVRTDGWAWVRAPRAELYDLEADPGEANSVHARHPDVTAELDAEVEAVLAGAIASERAGAPDAEELEALAALGYAFPSAPAEPTGADPKDMLASLQELNALAVMVDQGRFQEAVTEARRLIARDPHNNTLHVYLAQALAYLGRLDEAIVEARAAFQGSGSMDEDGTILAMYLAQAGRTGEAEELLRAFTEAQPRWPEHWFNLGNLLAQEERFGDAVEAYEHARELDPASPPTLTNLAEALSWVDDAPPSERARAVRVIDRAIALLPGDDRPSLTKVRVLRNLGRYEEARELARRLSERKLRNVPPAELAKVLRSLEQRRGKEE
jgi:arylsulfatase A-like enzyme